MGIRCTSEELDNKSEAFMKYSTFFSSFFLITEAHIAFFKPDIILHFKAFYKDPGINLRRLVGDLHINDST